MFWWSYLNVNIPLREYQLNLENKYWKTYELFYYFGKPITVLYIKPRDSADLYYKHYPWTNFPMLTSKLSMDIKFYLFTGKNIMCTRIKTALS